ncbi:MAG: phospholipid carrier-dependent glycosyltransferase [Pseudanabaenaceae cyanobacterium bins.39]|nr:phospholipid carrier-dependent glycosyltransferase [Pseudanabaenaceae cyanobacterium bins.39]
MITNQPQRNYFFLGIVIILIASLSLRLWDLDRFAYPVFDEVHFPKFAEGYLAGQPPNDGHPPLGKYLIALGILLFGHNEIGYRIASAVIGGLIPTLIIGLTYLLTQQSGTAILAGCLTLADGLLLVESRYGLMNGFLVAFGLVSQIFLLAGLRSRSRFWLLSLSGIMLGACAGVKWNGAGFWLMTWALIAIALILRFISHWQKAPDFQNLAIADRQGRSHAQQLFHQLGRLAWYEYIFYFLVLPLIAYISQWMPHVLMILKTFAPNAVGVEWWQNLGKHLLLSNQYIYNWNTSVYAVGTPDHPIHPYCSSPASWFLMMRPVSYYFQVKDAEWFTVTAIGNPILWWSSSLAVVGMAIATLVKFSQKPHLVNWGCLYVLVGYGANYLPWFRVNRCLFIYHYMSPLTFSFIALAMVIAWLYQQQQASRHISSSTTHSIDISISSLNTSNTFSNLLNTSKQSLAVIIITLILSAQIFFTPIWLGLPLSPKSFYTRMWFQPNSLIKGFNWI